MLNFVLALTVMFLECRFSFRGQLAVEVPKAKNVRTNTDAALIFIETVHRWDKTETLSSKSKAPNKKPADGSQASIRADFLNSSARS